MPKTVARLKAIFFTAEMIYFTMRAIHIGAVCNVEYFFSGKNVLFASLAFPQKKQLNKVFFVKSHFSQFLTFEVSVCQKAKKGVLTNW